MRIDEVRLPANDLAAQRAFYVDLLGLPTEPGEESALVLRAGASRLVFTHAHTGWSGIYHFAFNIPENRFAEATEWVSGRLPLIKSNSGETEFDFENWNAHALYFYDPSGNVVEFIARHDLAAEPGEEPFSGRSILSVSEIGLATEDVAATVKSIQEAMPVGVYDGQGSESFTAIGDPHGLLIVVKTGRTWFPDTDKPAHLLPLEAIVSLPNGARYAVSSPPVSVRRLSASSHEVSTR